MTAGLIPSCALRWQIRKLYVPQTASNGEILIGGKAYASSISVLQQWWHHPNEAHNAATDFNGEWRDIPIAGGTP